MESCNNFIPFDYSDMEEEQQQQFFPQQLQCFRCPTTRGTPLQRCQHNFNLQEETSSSSDTDTTSTSSSSSSSSDSELEDINMQMKRTKIGTMKQQRKWFTIINLQGLRPQDVKVRVNAQQRVLVIKTKRNIRNRQQLGFQQHVDNVVRVVPLPKNIVLDKLKVKTTPTGDLVVCAPYRFRSQHTTGLVQPKQQLQFPRWVPIHLTFKGNNIFGTQQEEQYYNTFNMPQQLARNLTNYYPTTHSYGCTSQGKQWKGLKSLNTTGQVPDTLPTQIVRDEVTGQLMMVLNVNTRGFLPQEVLVRLSQVQRVLIIEANKQQQLLWENQQQGEITVKYLRREFFIPQQVDVTRINFRVLPNGLLIVQLPIIAGNTFGQQQGQTVGWNKELRA